MPNPVVDDDWPEAESPQSVSGAVQPEDTCAVLDYDPVKAYYEWKQTLIPVPSSIGAIRLGPLDARPG